MSLIPKFICSACGECCSQIQGLTSDSEKRFIQEYGFGKMPLVQITPINEMTFPLWDFEAKRFTSYEINHNMDANIRPSRGILDLRSNKFIIFTYHMNSKACPFLAEEGKCKIYNERRAFICHLFPFNKSPFLETGKGDSNEMFGVCPNITEIIDKLDYKNKKELIKQLHNSFGNTFLAAIQHDYIQEWSNKLILELMKNNIIKPAINYPYDFLKKRINNAEKIDLMDFLVESGYKTKEEIDNLINNFEDFDNAKKRIKDFIV